MDINMKKNYENVNQMFQHLKYKNVEKMEHLHINGGLTVLFLKPKCGRE